MSDRTTVSTFAAQDSCLVHRQSPVSRLLKDNRLHNFLLSSNAGPLHPIHGNEQGIAISRRLASMSSPPDVVYSSSLHRAVSTSQLIVHALGKTKNSVRVEDGLIEWLTPSVRIFVCRSRCVRCNNCKVLMIYSIPLPTSANCGT